MRRSNIYALLLLTTVLVLINFRLIEAGRVLSEDCQKLIHKDAHRVLLVPLDRGSDPPPAPNPDSPSLADSWADTPPSLRAQTNPHGLRYGVAYNPSP
ncbi:hypothetical protein TIFTF001_018095 [Ficus carica]|uniref:Uncharacterized protein n=1 Tax=Ficus carica TaxID=3494 RepID=A0AA88D7L5_FICCA|nr:hypothetical protein TIFTF001_018095 [Ficus carica]